MKEEPSEDFPKAKGKKVSGEVPEKRGVKQERLDLEDYELLRENRGSNFRVKGEGRLRRARDEEQEADEDELEFNYALEEQA